MNKEIESILLQFKTAIDFAKGPSRIKYNFEISDAEKLYEYIINTKKENQRLINVLNELEKLTISICENCYEDRETERIKKRINELKESDK